MILVCGSFAYDTIMVFPDRFARHILPDQVHILNVSFMVPSLRREFGGCAGNIAYNLGLLETPTCAMGTVGDDFEAYARWMDQNGLDRRHVRVIAGTYTAQAFITTDADDNQITAFHPGAMAHAHVNQVRDVAGVRLGIVSPDGRDGMIQHAQQFAEAGIPFVFDPGQGLPMFDGPELLAFVHQASYLTVNDYEARLFEERAGQSLQSLAGGLRALVVTRGAQGSTIYAEGREWVIPPVAPVAVVDPTGCGDAYRAGLLKAILLGLDWDSAGRMASLMGSIKIAASGTQNHRVTPLEFEQRFEDAFGYRL